MLKVKVMILGGASGEYEADGTSTTVKDIVDIFKADKDIDVSNYTIRHDGVEVPDPSGTIATAKIILARAVKGASSQEDVSFPDLDGEPELEVDNTAATETTKKSDIFVKEYVENADVKILRKELLKWTLENPKSKNKHLQTRKAELLGEPKEVQIGSASYETVVESVDGEMAVRTKENTLLGRIDFKALPGESEEELVNRFNREF